jgi:glycosyltransferase involved in cell wall biosynthesis
MWSFSVIIPTFNRATLLASTLESVFAQRVSDFEVIVVDDGSTDGTMDYLRSLGKRVNVFQQRNRGAGPARNFGARHAVGKYLAFLDSDDLWFPWSLEIYREVIRGYGDPAFIAGKPYIFSKPQDLHKVKFGATTVERFADYFASGDQLRWWGGSSLVIRRDAFIDVGGFTEEWVNDEDADLTLRLGVASGFVQITAPVTFAYREHAGSVQRDLQRLLTGTWSRVRAEKKNQYPGGERRAKERRRILTRDIRSVVVGCLKLGLFREAWMLYWATFRWHASLGRVKFLIGAPLLAVISPIRRVGAARTEPCGDRKIRSADDVH